MSVTVTLHLWWLGAYLLVGLVLLLPLAALYHLDRYEPDDGWSRG